MPAATPPPRPLIIRLRNWVGDVTLGVPTLQRLADAGYAPQLLGKGWARDLLAGHGWPVHVLAKTLPERVRQLRALRRDAGALDPGFERRLNAVCFPYSLSSALEMRLAGLRAIGHAHEGRSLLLGRSVTRQRGRHELEVYWHLGSALLGADAALPVSIDLRLTAAHREQARALREQHGVKPGYIVICPFAGGTWAKQDKTWPEFAAFAADELRALGRDLLVCPGPGEEALADTHFAGVTQLRGVGLGAYAALLADAGLMISNDTGPGHMAAAVGAPLLSVLGPSDPALWRAWGPSVRIVQGTPSWPQRAQVLAQATAMLRPA
ncbi:MAG: glycosyltransferase family 9 protein [Rubrivivax sp.]|nr:glycosyltransferase family 9 protein [Rubrivivax sp.]